MKRTQETIVHDYLPEENIPTRFKHGHHTGHLVQIFGENMIQVSWGKRKRCMCSGPPAPILFKRENGTWWGAQSRVYWGDPESDEPTKIWYEAKSVQAHPK